MIAIFRKPFYTGSFPACFMLPDLSEIKKVRRIHGLTQSGLAKLAGVSQSLIAKVESGRIDPTYSNVRRIFSVTEGLARGKEGLASDVMARRIISCSSGDSVSSAVGRMRAHGISQLPVIDHGALVGLVSESDLLELLAEGKDISRTRISGVMQDSPPIVSGKTPVRALIDLLRYSPIVLVADGARFEGVVTKSDILMAKQR